MGVVLGIIAGLLLLIAIVAVMGTLIKDQCPSKKKYTVPPADQATKDKWRRAVLEVKTEQAAEEKAEAERKKAEEKSINPDDYDYLK